MSEPLDFLRTHDEAFRSRARLASLYADFRAQRASNPDGYAANSGAWLGALSAASRAGVLPDRFVLQAAALGAALQTEELGRPLALGAVLADAVRGGNLVPLRAFLDARRSVYAKRWVPTAGEAMAWGLRWPGVGGDDNLATAPVGGLVVLANVEAVASEVLAQVALTATSAPSRIYSRALFAATLAPQLSETDLAVLLVHLARDRQAIAYAPASDTIRFSTPGPITASDTTIAALRTLLFTLSAQTAELATQISALDSQTRAAVASRDLAGAKSALRRKRAAEATLAARGATRGQLEEVYARLEQAADAVQIVRVMAGAAEALRVLNGEAAGVEGVVEGLREEMARVEEVGAVLREVGEEGAEEGGLEEELEGLEREAQDRETQETRRRLEELDTLDSGKTDEDQLVAGPVAEKTARETLAAVPAGSSSPA